MIKHFFITRSTKNPVVQIPRKNIRIIFLNYDAQAMIKCIQNRELRRSGPIYILQEIPNHQLSTVSRLYVTTFQLVVPQGPETKLLKPKGASPHGTPRLAWSPMWVLVWPDLLCEFQATPLPFSHTPSMGKHHFQSKSQLTYRACWFPMAVSN